MNTAIPPSNAFRLNTGRRIVITGIGVISSAGLNQRDFWDNVVKGRCAARKVTRFDSHALGMNCHLACEIHDFPARRWVNEKQANRLDPAILYAIAAAKDALTDSGLDLKRCNPSRLGVVEGTSVCGLDRTLHEHVRALDRGFRAIQPSAVVSAFCGGASSEIAIELAGGLGAICQATTITTACSSGNDALGYAMRAIETDQADVIIAGATEAPIVDGYFQIFSLLKVMSQRDEEPATAMCPYDRDRDGFVLGEGSAFFVLEEMHNARARGARIYAEILGHGQACDAYHMVALPPGAPGAVLAMQNALFTARLDPTRIAYVNTHGSATVMNDVAETQAINKVFGAHARKLQCSGTKPVMGHMMGASAGIEAAICCLALQQGVIPPTPNLEHPDPQCALDFVPHEARAQRLNAVMSLSAGFGGKHSALILGRLP